jgi:HD-GYP domain-containing protein (c-di-GMP phosphodiesterase class II)
MDEQAMIDIALGALLMDVGFSRIPETILEKTSPLTGEEWETVKTHVQLGRDMLAATPGMPKATMSVVGTHHERLDGSGYPRGLVGSAIPLPGQIAGIVDFFAATTRTRTFMKPMSPSAALQLLYKQRGNYFSEKMVDGFIQTLGTYPTGFLVELNTGEVGVVSSQNRGWRLRPRVILILDADKKPYGSLPIVNLVENLTDDQDNPMYIVSSLADGTYGIDVEQLGL